MNTKPEKLPLYKVVFDEDSEIQLISIVDYPAVESNFFAFADQQPFYFVSEDEHKVIGCLLRANYPILRQSEDGSYYNLVFDADVIEQLATKFINSNRLDTITLSHNGIPVSGVTVTQLFLKDVAKGVDPVGFTYVADHSLFAECKIDNPVIWEQIKEHKLNGFSIEGLFTTQRVIERTENNNIFYKMKSIKNKLISLLLKFEAVATDKGELLYDEAELAEGVELYTIDPETAERKPVEDGEYLAEDKKITVVEGKVAKIEPIEVEPEPEAPAEVKAEEVTEPEPEMPAEPVVPEYCPKDDIEALKAEIEVLKAEIEALKAKIAEPVAEPVVEEFASIRRSDGRLSRLEQYAAALRNN